MALVDFLLHFDRHLLEFVGAYGPWVYAILFAIIFVETGVVIWPFLPGDSLLFAAGALCATGSLSTPITAVLLVAAAFAGDAVNYSIGRYIGPRVFAADDTVAISHRLLNREHLKRAHVFFEKYGGKAVILGRFVPIVRTFVPFVAGAAEMTRKTFVLFNIAGGVLWVALCIGAGVWFGNIEFVKKHFEAVIVGIIVVSLVPVLVEFLRERSRLKAAPAAPPPQN
jgi:membrane-associated protein